MELNPNNDYVIEETYINLTEDFWHQKLLDITTLANVKLKPDSMTYQQYYVLLSKYQTSCPSDVLKYIVYG